jgi:hypothetical protein
MVPALIRFLSLQSGTSILSIIWTSLAVVEFPQKLVSFVAKVRFKVCLRFAEDLIDSGIGESKF